jgi:hypothetical protein
MAPDRARSWLLWAGVAILMLIAAGEGGQATNETAPEAPVPGGGDANETTVTVEQPLPSFFAVRCGARVDGHGAVRGLQQQAPQQAGDAPGASDINIPRRCAGRRHRRNLLAPTFPPSQVPG